MSNDPLHSGTGADDLLGRWFAHHGKTVEPGEPVHRDEPGTPAPHVPMGARPSEAAAARQTRPSASAALAERRSVEPEVAQPSRPTPDGFEPVILRSVRKKSESQEQEKKGRRLSRLRSRVSDSPDEPDSDDAEPVEPVEPTPVPPVEPDLPGPDTEPATVLRDSAPKRRLVTRTKRPEGGASEDRRRHPATPPRHAGPPTTGTGGAARGLLAAARAATPTPSPAALPRPTAVSEPRPAPEPVRAPVPAVASVPAVAAVVAPVDAPVPAPAPAPAAEMPAIYQFAPLKSARRFLSLMLLTGLVASTYLGYGAYQSRDSLQVGIAGIAMLATMVIWAIRAGATVTRLTVRRGQLEISRQGGRIVFDLASTYTSIEVVGRPGSKKWKVLFHRRGMSPVVVDASMVDALDFMRVLRFFRPDLAPGGRPAIDT